MKFINFQIEKSRAEVIAMIKDNSKVNSNIRFAPQSGTPFMHVKENGNSIRIKCEMLGRSTKDNGFFIGGTFFYGRIKEKDGVTALRGITVTAPIYHAFLIGLICYLILKSFEMKAISVIPIFAIAFEYLFFKDEFKKQGYISRYLGRAFKRMDS